MNPFLLVFAYAAGIGALILVIFAILWVIMIAGTHDINDE